MTAAELSLTAHGPALAAVALAGAAGVAAALLHAAPPLRPQDLCDAYGAALDGLGGSAPKPLDLDGQPCTPLDSPLKLLELVHGVLDALNASSCGGGAVASAFLSAALRDGGLYSLVFRDERAARAAVMRGPCEATVLAFERACKRSAKTVTRPSGPGVALRTVFTRHDGAPLHSFVLFRPAQDERLYSSFLEAFESEPLPLPVFRHFADTRLRSREASLDAAAVVRAQLGERVAVAASASFVAGLTVLLHNVALASIPAPCMARVRAAAAATALSPNEIDGLLLTLGHLQLGAASLHLLAALGESDAVFAAILAPEVDGFTRIMAAFSSAQLDEPSAVGLLVAVSHAAGRSEHVARALVGLGAFVLLQPYMLHDHADLAVRAAFAAASIAAACRAAGEDVAAPLRLSGVHDVITDLLHRLCGARGAGAPGFFQHSAVAPGFFALAVPRALELLRPDAETALQLASLRRLGAGLAAPTERAAAVGELAGPELVALRGCALAHDAFLYAAGVFVLKAMQPLTPPPSPRATQVAPAPVSAPPTPLVAAQPHATAEAATQAPAIYVASAPRGKVAAGAGGRRRSVSL